MKPSLEEIFVQKLERCEFLMHKLLANVYYHLGDFVSRFLNYVPFVYRLYSFLMNKSVDHDDLSGKTVWKPPIKTEE